MKRQKHTVLEVINLTPETFIIRLDRKDFHFEPGQYVVIRIPDQNKGREYSIYSGIDDDYLDFLVREIPEGSFSRYLRHLLPGSKLDVEGPKGYFILDEKTKQGHKAMLIATGTGISPFHSYVKIVSRSEFQDFCMVCILPTKHMVVNRSGRKTICCVLRVVIAATISGRVTYYLKENKIDADTICYLCGNSQMIDEVSTILERYGLPPENIRTEVFF